MKKTVLRLYSKGKMIFVVLRNCVGLCCIVFELVQKRVLTFDKTHGNIHIVAAMKQPLDIDLN